MDEEKEWSPWDPKNAYRKETAVLRAALDDDVELAFSLINKLTAEEKQKLADTCSVAFAMIVNPGAARKMLNSRMEARRRR